MSIDVSDQIGILYARVETLIVPVSADEASRHVLTDPSGSTTEFDVESGLGGGHRRHHVMWSVSAVAVLMVSVAGLWLVRQRTIDPPSNTTNVADTPTTGIRAQDDLARIVGASAAALGWAVGLPDSITTSSSRITGDGAYAEVRLALPDRGDLLVSIHDGGSSSTTVAGDGRQLLRLSGSASVFLGTDSNSARAVELFDGTTIVYVRSESALQAQSLDDLATIAIDVNAHWSPSGLVFDEPNPDEPTTVFVTSPPTTSGTTSAPDTTPTRPADDVAPTRVSPADVPAMLPPLDATVDGTATAERGDLDITVTHTDGRLCTNVTSANFGETGSCADDPAGLAAFVFLQHRGDAESSPESTFELVIVAPAGPVLRLVDSNRDPVCELRPHAMPELGDITMWACAGQLDREVWDLEIDIPAPSGGSASIVAELARPPFAFELRSPRAQIGDVPTGERARWVHGTVMYELGTTGDWCERVAVGRRGKVIGYTQIGPDCGDEITDEAGNKIGQFVDGFPVLDTDPPRSATVAIDQADVVVIGDGGPVESAVDGSLYAVSDQTTVSSGLARPQFFDWHDAAETLITVMPPGLPVVVTMGSNDGQQIDLDDGTVLPFGSPEWTHEYSKRVSELAAIFTGAGHPVVWILPGGISRPAFAAQYDLLNTTIRNALLGRPEVTVVDTTALPIGTAERTADGYHLNDAGLQILSAELERVLHLLI